MTKTTLHDTAYTPSFLKISSSADRLYFRRQVNIIPLFPNRWCSFMENAGQVSFVYVISGFRRRRNLYWLFWVFKRRLFLLLTNFSGRLVGPIIDQQIVLKRWLTSPPPQPPTPKRTTPRKHPAIHTQVSFGLVLHKYDKCIIVAAKIYNHFVIFCHIKT
jgi:hypothetical protein